ncbi:lipid-A-disaccharide synthase [Carboxydochorda subterranea]|uniref:Lipid-A-disaccharide synthase n=1 Tax=Carboxydichorda subterranea TaxID=3109565 RepID=A0ABZ1BVT1_9FIRM|nr:lipid-A-disaccharide synthase [Limnochorda sp. L945t]WRP16900.1 lipid-A-disaccharide synthase [Limnochorda sp. L945t]
MVVAGEASGDAYGAALVGALRSIRSPLSCFGMGGSAMARSGVHLVYDVTGRGTVGFAESIRQIPLFRRLLARLVEAARRLRPNVAVLIDFPGFNLRLGPALRHLGVPVVYYIAPAVWAWGAGRARSVASFADRVVCAFDFEVPLYEQAGARGVHWLGHPILDDVPPRPSRSEALADLGLSGAGGVVAWLPGSRIQEVERLYPVMVEAAALIRARRPQVEFVASVAPGIDPALLEHVGGKAQRDLGIRLVGGGIWRSLAVADVAVVASGTATLQAALWQVPMVVVYRVSEPTYQMARRLVRISHVSLPNVVCGSEVVEELLQHAVRPDRVAQSVLARLASPQRLQQEREALAAVRARLGQPGAASRAARLILEAARP